MQKMAINRVAAAVALVVVVLAGTSCVRAQLSTTFYKKTCPNLMSIVEEIVQQAVDQEARMAASLLRLHFHDCFVQGCDGSILLDDTPTMTGEKTSPPNNNSVRGFDVIDAIKSAVEAACPATVSCADIVALAAEISVAYVNGPSWKVPLGRRDSLSANISLPTQFLPAPTDNLSTIVTKFGAVGLDERDAVVLSGGHTIGRARCVTFTTRIYNFSGSGSPDPTINTSFLASLQNLCPANGANANSLTNFDVTTPDAFDNAYYSNLLSGNGLLQSDEELYVTPDGTTPSTASLVQTFSSNQVAFFKAFAKSMVKMGNISPLTGSDGQIRLNCRKVNNN